VSVTARAPSLEHAGTAARLPRVFAVVPACDEAPRIAEVVRTMPPRVERIVLVDDGSRDETVARARDVGDARLVVVSHARRRGVGAAIEAGYRRAFADGADLAVVLAGDGQMWPDDLVAVIEPVLTGRVGYAKGNRLDHEAVREMPLVRRVGGEILSGMTSLALRRLVRDSQCGYTALSRGAWAQIERAPIWSSYGYPNDLLVRLHRAGVATCDVPVRAVYVDKRGGMRVRHALLVPYVLALALWAPR
jgi:glycosyltransferase involved in cell wall biosynthesis